MSDWRRNMRRLTFCMLIVLVPCALRVSPSTWFRPDVAHAQEIVFVKALEEAEKAIQEARDFEAEIYAPEEFALALNYLAEAKDEAKLFSAAQQKKDAHLLSARTSGEAVSLLAEKAQYQAKVAGAKAIEVKSDREIIAIKAQIADTFNTDVNRQYSSKREQLFGELGMKQSVKREARRVRTQAEGELRKLTLEGPVAPPPQ